MKKCICLLVFLLTGAAANAGAEQFRCLTSVGTKKTINLQFNFASSKPDEAFVIYGSGDKRIPLKLASSVVLDNAEATDRPLPFEDTWVEQVLNPGKYVFEHQGAVINAFRYINHRGIVYEFEDNLEVNGNSIGRKKCAW
jgi:hypothetical protein